MNTRSGANPLRMNMNTFPARQTSSRLQNTQKTAGSWGGGMQGGFGSLGGGAPGLGRPGQLSGFAQVMGGGGGQGPIDMSDFPSLSGGPRPPQNNAAAGWNSSVIRQPTVQQSSQHPQPQRAPSTAPSQHSLDQYDGQRSSQPSADRIGGGSGGEDFPPLGRQVNGDAVGHSNGFGGGIRSPDMQAPQANGQQAQIPLRQTSGAYQSNQQQPLSGQSSLSQQQLTQNGQGPASAAGLKKWADLTENEKWTFPGLVVMLEARRQADNGGPVDETLPPLLRSQAVLGVDLNELGMNLDSTEPLYPTFAAFPATSSSNNTFDFHDRHTVPDFVLPSAYTVTNVPPLSSRMSAFSDETLFSIFYQNPRDIHQELAAQELAARDWRWHKVLRQWLQKDTRDSNTASSLPLIDLALGAPVGAQPVRLGERTERGVYIFFDALNWRRERREFMLDYEQLDLHRNPGVVGGGGSNGGPGGAVGAVGGAQGGSSQIPGA